MTMNDVYIIKSRLWGGEPCVRTVFASDEEDACQAHQLHYPGELVVSVQPA
jgi:hypothetical protein